MLILPSKTSTYNTKIPARHVRILSDDNGFCTRFIEARGSLTLCYKNTWWIDRVIIQQQYIDCEYYIHDHTLRVFASLASYLLHETRNCRSETAVNKVINSVGFSVEYDYGYVPIGYIDLMPVQMMKFRDPGQALVLLPTNYQY